MPLAPTFASRAMISFWRQDHHRYRPCGNCCHTTSRRSSPGCARAHNAAMECYRRAMIREQTFEGWRENLSQATKLSRTWATLLEALNRHRGKGQQKVTVEHVHVHAGGRASGGRHGGNPGGWGSTEIGGTTPCNANCPCT